jgi:hypothetical protein
MRYDIINLFNPVPLVNPVNSKCSNHTDGKNQGKIGRVSYKIVTK